MKVSIIVPMKSFDNYFLSKLFYQLDFCIKCEYEIILIFDEKFNLEMFEHYEKIKDKWKFIFNETPIGAFESRRRGVDVATGDLVWFVDSTDNLDVLDPDETVLDFDINFYRLSYKLENKNEFFNLEPLRHDDGSDITEYSKLNPITSKFVLKKFINPFLGLCIFRKDFIKKLYKKLPTLDGFNRFSGLYLVASALLFARNIKYRNDQTIYTYIIKDKYLIDDKYDKGKYTPFYELNALNYFNNEDVEIFKEFLKHDTNDVSEEILNYIKDCKSIKND